jgi:hypothetical protein
VWRRRLRQVDFLELKYNFMTTFHGFEQVRPLELERKQAEPARSPTVWFVTFHRELPCLTPDPNPHP